MHLCKCSYNLMIPMLRKFSDDISARFSGIMKNVTISFIKEYRRPHLKPPRDVIDDVIIMKNTSVGIIWDGLFISEVKVKLCLIFQNFQNGRHFELVTNFITGSWIYQKIAISISDILSFDRRSSSNIDGAISISKFGLLLDLVTSSMMSWVLET